MGSAERIRTVAALGVPLALLALAGSGYLVLVAGGRALPAAGFASLSSFYLLANTVGRGTFAALELELTRTVAQARATGSGIAEVCRSVLIRGATLLAGVLVLVGLTTPLLVRTVGGLSGVLLLGVAAVGLALSSFVRGPLAGDGRYGAFSGSLVAEAGTCLAGAALLLGLGVDRWEVWAGLLATAPFVGVLVVALRYGRVRVLRSFLGRTRQPLPPALRTTVTTLLWASLLFLCSQAVWNLAPVISTGRSVADPALAAGFAATAVLLRAPVMIFPAVQALVLPRLVRGGASTSGTSGGPASRRVVAVGVVVAAIWMLGATLLAPLVVELLFTLDTLPGRETLIVLAGSILLGTIAQFVQARLLAESRSAAVAIIWLVALVVLIAIASVLPAPVPAAAWGQFAATLVALVGMLALIHHRSASST